MVLLLMSYSHKYNIGSLLVRICDIENGCKDIYKEGQVLRIRGTTKVCYRYDYLDSQGNIIATGRDTFTHVEDSCAPVGKLTMVLYG